MKILRYVGPADYITIVNGLLGFLAIMYIIDRNFEMAYIFLLIVLILDGIDGWLARYLKSSYQLGKYLDSISDTVSFSFAPAILIYSIFYNLDYTSFNYLPNALVVFVCFIIVGFGMLRLAWFIEYGHKLKYFQGLPTPALALFILLVLQSSIQSWLTQTMTLTVIFLVTLLTVADIKYPKLKTPLMLAAAGFVVLSLLLAFVFNAPGLLTDIIIYLSSGILLIYIIAGPILINKLSKSRL